VKGFRRKISTVLAGALKNIRQPFSGSKNVKNIGLEGRQIISLLGAPNY
jgi:hypothetical protein